MTTTLLPTAPPTASRQRRERHTALTLALLAAAGMAACGGSDNDSPAPAAPPAAVVSADREALADLAWVLARQGRFADARGSAGGITGNKAVKDRRHNGLVSPVDSWPISPSEMKSFPWRIDRWQGL